LGSICMDKIQIIATFSEIDIKVSISTIVTSERYSHKFG
jgi:hypothetical protein